jgi:uncharacterized membrane protein YphA (DoxX/SURF4 family)
LEKRYSMKSLFSTTTLILLARIFLGGLFVTAGLEKMTDVQAFANSILQYRVVGQLLATGTATILPSLELLCGLSLILGLYPRGSELLITAMLVGFTVLIVSALLRGLDISCGCFSQDPNVSKIGYQKIAENCGLILLSVWLFLVRTQDTSIVRIFKQQPESPFEKDPKDSEIPSE